MAALFLDCLESTQRGKSSVAEAANAANCTHQDELGDKLGQRRHAESHAKGETKHGHDHGENYRHARSTENEMPAHAIPK